eukprot:14867487-Heterocapsa_arctica.AAC.1
MGSHRQRRPGLGDAAGSRVPAGWDLTRRRYLQQGGPRAGSQGPHALARPSKGPRPPGMAPPHAHAPRAPPGDDLPWMGKPAGARRRTGAQCPRGCRRQ